jgi:hypothetical protein
MPQRPYIDFKLYLTRPTEGQGACQVALLPTPEVGETTTPVAVSAENIPTPELLAQLASKSITLRQLATLGKQLGHCLLPEGTIRNLFEEAYKRAGQAGGVRLRLIIADHGLKQWPWEYVYLNRLERPDGMHGFLALDPLISVVRDEPLPQPRPVVPEATTGLTNVRMLIASALPEKQRKLQLDKEVEIIIQAISRFHLEGLRIAYEPVLMDATPAELGEALRGAESTYIFHFAGHGISLARPDWFNRGADKEEGYLLLVEDKTTKKEARLSAEDLAKWLQPAGVRLAVLGACHSGARHERYPWDGVAGALVARDIAAVIAMQYEVQDDQAIAFHQAFYAALGLGLSLDEAVWSGRVAMLQTTSSELDAGVNVEWGVPVLYSRLPTGALFPERMAKAGPAAEGFRKVFTQTVTGIQQGTMTGVKVQLIENGVKVVMKVKEALGQITGIEAGTAGAGANIVVEQEIETAGPGSVIIGGTFDRL